MGSNPIQGFGDPMKTKKNILIVYYSHSGHTKAVAETLAKELNADTDEIIDTTNRSGIFGMIRSGFDVLFRQTPPIQTKQDPSNYNLIILATPVWAGTMVPALRTYCLKYGKALQHSYAAVTTQQGETPQRTFRQLASLIGSAPTETVSLQTSLIKQKSYRAHLKPYIKAIKARLLALSKRARSSSKKN